MTSKDLIKVLKREGWFKVSQKGSHIKFELANKLGHVTVAHHPGKDIPKGTLNAILKKAGIK